MMKRLAFLLSLIACAWLFATAETAENLLRNSDFQDGGAAWSIGNEGTAVFPGDGTVEVAGGPQRNYVLQAALPLDACSTYFFSVEASGTPDSQADFYLESGPAQVTVLKKVSLSEEWTRAELELTTPEKNADTFYAVLSMPGKQTGTARFRNPRLTLKLGTLRNGAFEGGNAGWEFANASISEEGGNHGLVAKLNGTEQKATIRQGALKVEAGKIYRLSYDVRGGTDNRFTDIQSATWSRIVVLDDANEPIPETAVWRDCFGTTWQHKEATFVAARDMEVALLGELRDPGTVHFDNVAFAESNAPLPTLEIVLDPPFSYHNGVVQGSDQATFTGTVYPLFKGREIRISFGEEKASLPGDDPATFAFAIPAACGSTAIRAELLDDEEKVIGSAEVPFTVRPTPERSVCFDKDNVLLIDGKPFFPIGSWGNLGGMESPEAMKAFANLGINIVLCTTEDIDNAADSGLMAIMDVGNYLNRPDEAALQRSLPDLKESYASLKKHPSLIAWFNTDEPAWRGDKSEISLRTYNRIRTLVDDERPIFLNEAPRGRVEEIRPHSLGCDIYGVDIYPIPGPNSHSDLEDKMMTSVGKYTDICREVVRGSKPIWMTIQGFAWGHFTLTPPVVYPTFQELRFMAYDAIAHGAMGLMYWGLDLGDCQDDVFLAALKGAIQEIRSLTAILIAPNRIGEGSGTTSDHSALRICRKSNADGEIWIVLNESGDDFTAELSCAEFPVKLMAIGEDREVAVSGGAFREHFAPYAVHVYADAQKPLPTPLATPATSRQKPRVDASNLPRNFSKGSWIWAPGLVDTTDSQARFRIPVALDTPLEHAFLSIAADDGFICTVNGKEIMRQRNWKVAWTLDIAKELHVGDNEILIYAADLGGAPCGVLYSLTLSDGRTLLSGSDTLCALPGKSDWQPSAIVAPYGEGAWLSGVSLMPYTTPTLYNLPIQVENP